MRLSNREKVLLSLLVWMLLFYVFYFHFYSPLNQKVTILVEQNNKLRQELISAKHMDKNQNLVNDRHNKYQIELAKLNLLIPCSPGIPEVIAFLEETSLQSKAILQGINYRDKIKDEEKFKDTSAGTLDFEVEVAGSYYDLLTFLRYVDKAPRIYNFNHLKLAAVPKQEETVAGESDAVSLTAVQRPEFKGGERFDGNNILMTVNLTTYFYKGMVLPMDKFSIDKKVKPADTGRDNPFNT